MRLTIDNNDGQGARDLTSAVATTPKATVERRLNLPAEMQFSLIATGAMWAVPVAGARVVLANDDGSNVFTGYLAAAPRAVFTGQDQNGPVYRYEGTATSDEWLLDRRAVPVRVPFVGRTPGGILIQLTNELLPGAFDTSAVADAGTDLLPAYASDWEKTWSEHAAELALCARASYRVVGGAIRFQPAGSPAYLVDEQAVGLEPQNFQIWSPATYPKKRTGALPPAGLMNDVTVIGPSEPNAYVKNYFLGDGSKLSFYLSEIPFARYGATLLYEDFLGTALDPLRWQVTGNSAAVAVSGGMLRVNGGPVAVQFAEAMALGGAVVLQHGGFQFHATASGLVGGLYSGGTNQAQMMAGFLLTPAGGQTQIVPVVNGVAAGAGITTSAGLEYVFSTRLYASEVFLQQPFFHSSVCPEGDGRGGNTVAATAHLVLEVHVIDPSNPATLAGVSTILFDGELGAVPPSCTYMLINAGAGMNCTVAFTSLLQPVDVDVSSALPGQASRTRLVGALSDGAECEVTSTPELCFYTVYVPAPNEAIRASYRSAATAVVHVQNPESVAGLAGAGDDGVRAGIRHLVLPLPSTAADCENAALALLDDASQQAWAGQYQAEGDALPGGAGDVWPGDGVQVTAASRGANFQAVVRTVKIEVDDAANSITRYTVSFANDAAASMSFSCRGASAARLLDASLLELAPTPAALVGTTFIADLPLAEMTAVTSTTFSVDAGCDPPAGGGIEVRRSDTDWGSGGGRNLAGQFTTRAFTLPRLAQSQTYFLRQYDGSGRYSRYSTELYTDYPL